MALVSSSKYQNSTCISLIFAAVFISYLISTFAEYQHPIKDKRAIFLGNATFCSKIQCSSKDCCSSNSCVDAAIQMCTTMDLHENPCEDFHKFVCGGFQNNSHREDIREANIKADNEQLKKLLSKPGSLGEKIKVIKEMTSFYARCIDKETLERESTNLTEELINTLGGWKLLDPLGRVGFDFMWKTYFKTWAKNGIIPDDLLSFDVDAVHGKYAIRMKPATLSLPREIFHEGLHNEVVQSYWNFMKDVATLLGASEEDIDHHLKEVLQLEISLAEIEVKYAKEETAKHYSPQRSMSLANLMKLYPRIPWRVILLTQYPSLRSTDKILIFNGNKMEDIINLYDEREMTNILGNYVIWKAIAKVGVFISSKINELFHKHFEGNVHLYMNQQFDDECLLSLDRWECNCMDVTRKTYATALSYLYQYTLFGNAKIKMFNDITNGIRNFYMENVGKFIPEAGDGDSLKLLLNQIQYCFKFYDNPFSSDTVEKFYENQPKVDLTASFFRWYAAINSYNIRSHSSTYKTDVVHGNCQNLMNIAKIYLEDPVNEMVINNRIIVSPRFMQGTQFDLSLPAYINWARTGFHIARLMAFFIFIKDKNNEHVDLRYNEGADLMVKNSVCFEEELLHLVKASGDEKLWAEILNSKITSEATLDGIALVAAYSVYVELFRHAPPKALPGFEKYDYEQLFWISFGTWMCHRDYDDIRISRYRVLLAAVKYETFRENFACKKDTVMHPKTQCPQTWSLLQGDQRQIK